ncbi:MAG TPA: DUF4389 domain-containing protein [Gaiellales bacterium]|jgi:hypothetical protein|nr:DUF4389 domain-containing protein [Gaiellales bacterium]
MATNLYPVQLTVDYPDRTLNRLTSAFRIFTAIPILIVAGALAGGNGSYSWDYGSHESARGGAGGVGLLFAAPLLMILFRQKYPRWWFDWNCNLLALTNRIGAYVFLLTDIYPSTDEEQSVHLEVTYPDAQNDLNRWLPLVKWLLAIPHYVVLFFLYIGAVVCVIIAWFAILFTGRLPRGLFDYVVGVGRWGNRVVAYAFILTTDEYPPFRLGA